MQYIIALIGSIIFLFVVTKAGAAEREGKIVTMWSYAASAVFVIVMIILFFAQYD